MLVFLVKTLKRRIETVYRLLFRYTSWNVGIVTRRSALFSLLVSNQLFAGSPNQRKDTSKLILRRSDGHRVTVLFERLDYLHRKGMICAVEVEDDASFGEPKVIMELPVHMSYHFLRVCR